MSKNLGGINAPVNESQGGTNATTFNTARTNMGLNPLISEHTLTYNVISADRGLLIHYSGAGGVDLTLDPAATLGNGFNFILRNDAAANITINPNGAELINGAATLAVEPGQAVTVFCTGTAFYTEGQAVAVDGANVALSNLSGVAINTSLLPGADNSIDCGDGTHRFRQMYSAGLTTGTTAADTLVISARDVDGASNTAFITLTANNTPTCVLASDVTGTTQAAADNSTKLATTAYADRMLPLAGGTMTGDLILNGDPTVALQAATKQYVDTIASGITIKTPCYAGTTANLTATYANGAAGVGATLTNAGALAAFSVDGTSPSVNARILVKNQSSTLENGIYTLTTVGSGAVAWVLTRATDYDTPAEITVGSLVIIQNGTVNAVTSWMQTDTVTAVGTDPIEFTQFSAGIGANTALSNLASVAINTSLLPGSDATIDLGSAAKRIRNALVQTVQTGTTAADTLLLQAYDVDGASYTTFATLTANNTPTMALASAVTGTTQAASDNSTKLATTAYVDNQVSSAGANKALSNLAAVAINTALLSAADNTLEFGAENNRWSNMYATNYQTGHTNGNTYTLSAWDVDGATSVPFITFTAANTPTCALASAVTGVTQSASDNSTKLATTAYVDNQVSSIGANKALSNLSAVAINTSLLPGSDNSIDNGDGTHRFRQIYSAGLTTGTTAADTLIISARDVDGASNTAFITLTANNTPTCALSGAVTGVTQSASDNSTKLATTAYADAQVTAIAANKALSNLASVAINTSLLPASDNAIDLGDGTHRTRQIFSAGLTTGTTAADTLIISARDVDGASNTAFITLTANNTPTCVLASAVTATTQSAGDNSTKLATTAYVDNALTSGGGIVYITSQTASSSVTVNFDNNLTSTYDVYMITIEKLCPATDGTYLKAKFGTGGTPTYQSTNYIGDVMYSSTGGVIGRSNSATTAIDCGSSVDPESNSANYVGA